MIRKYFIDIFLLVLSATIMFLLGSWGFAPHQKINKLAVFTLPNEMIWFYKSNIEYLSKHSTDPDKRRYKDKNEAVKHYINIENYGENPFGKVPENYDNAIIKFSKDTILKNGIVPWWIYIMEVKLTKAFKNKDANEILYCSANIGHYIADACVPFHTTKYYNGKTLDEKGIHALFEARIPEIESAGYDFFIGKAEYIKNPLHTAWLLVKNSNSQVDTILRKFNELNSKFPSDKKFIFVRKGKKIEKIFSEDFAKQLSNEINKMVERNMQEAVRLVGCYWYTAWVDAGQPDLKQLKVVSGK